MPGSEAVLGRPNSGSNRDAKTRKAALRTAFDQGGEAGSICVSLSKKDVIYQRPGRQNGPRTDSDLGIIRRIFAHEGPAQRGADLGKQPTDRLSKTKPAEGVPAGTIVHYG